jgi:predicted PP-loop superfamily ATPase
MKSTTKRCDKSQPPRVYNRKVRCLLLVFAFGCLLACGPRPHETYLEQQLRYLQLGVQLTSEEKEVRRVLAQRGLRVGARLESPEFIALGAATRDGQKSAVRVISRRGVVLASDGALDDLFAPTKVALLEHFGGRLGEYLLIAEAHTRRGQDTGCVTLHRILPDGNAVTAVLDIAPLGSRACVSNLAPARAGRMAATIAWPGLHALATPQLDVELAFVEPPGELPPRVPVVRLALEGDWLERERLRLSTLRLSRAEFSERHTAGVARAAVALLTGQDAATQASAYRNAVATIYPASMESEVVQETVAHIERGWLDAEATAPAGLDDPREHSGPGADDVSEPEPLPIEEIEQGGATVIEPLPSENP